MLRVACWGGWLVGWCLCTLSVTNVKLNEYLGRIALREFNAASELFIKVFFFRRPRRPLWSASQLCFQPVGFVTFSTRAGAEAAKQDLQVSGWVVCHCPLSTTPLSPTPLKIYTKTPHPTLYDPTNNQLSYL